jgi:DNA-binding CsgD family transcriptional regulator
MARSSRHPGRYLAGSVVLLGAWTLVAFLLLAGDSFVDDGPLAFDRPALTETPAGGPSLERVADDCFPDWSARDTVKVVGGTVDGRRLFACYELDADGAVIQAAVVDANGHEVRDIGTLKRSGAWRWVGLASTDAAIYGALLVASVVLLLIRAIFIGARALPAEDSSPLVRTPLLWLLLAVPLVGWVVLLALPGTSRAGRWWLLRWIGVAFLGLLALSQLLAVADWLSHPPTAAWAALPVLSVAFGAVGARRWLVDGPAQTPEVSEVPGTPAVVAQAATEPVALAATPAPVPDQRGNGAAADPPALAGLTRRELDVLGQLALGRSNAQIAEALFLSEATVKSHVARLLTKLGFDNRVQAALFGQRHGLAPEEADEGT